MCVVTCVDRVVTPEVRAASRARMEARLLIADWEEAGVHADLEWRLGARGVTALTTAIFEGRSTFGWVVRRVVTMPNGQVLALGRVKPTQIPPHVHTYLFGECQVPGNACIVRWDPEEGLAAVFGGDTTAAFEAACLLANG